LSYAISCPPLNVFDFSRFALKIKDIATGKMMLRHHALHDKCALLNFANGDQRFVAGPRPRTTRNDYTTVQKLFFSLKIQLAGCTFMFFRRRKSVSDWTKQ
jgi:hypothetical protein